MSAGRLGACDVAVVLGSGLSGALRALADFTCISYRDLPGMPAPDLTGHAGEAMIGSLHGKRLLVFAGRAHLYQGFSAQDVTYPVTLAAECGAATMILTNAAGGLNPHMKAGDLMIIADHLNLTGVNPLTGTDRRDPFVDMSDAYSPRLRAMAHAAGTYELQEGVYAGLIGPSYETPAETRYLRTIGADAVGMSTVLETIAARAAKLDVLGISLIANTAGAANLSHAEVTETAATAAARMAALISMVIAQL